MIYISYEYVIFSLAVSEAFDCKRPHYPSGCLSCFMAEVIHYSSIRVNGILRTMVQWKFNLSFIANDNNKRLDVIFS